ncbi:uncharacterized protein TNCV_3520371 [Trichonephila clavipes]|nr:uncharacterized protein TNCV_3520371 [Trichonephila clavipes]
MNLPTPSQRFNKNESGLDTAVKTVATVSMQIAAKEAKDVSGHSDIPVAIDFTWQKHGHTSLNGDVIAISFYTSKVLDASILSRFCKRPSKMYNENFKANHFGNSGSMEVSGAIEIFESSESLHGLRYTKIWAMVTPGCIKQLTRCRGMEIQVLKDWNVLAMSRNDWGLNYEL